MSGTVPAPDLTGIRGLPAGARTLWSPAHPSNYFPADAPDRGRGGARPYSGAARRFVAICYHTPEEPADDHEVTPAWFANPDANASTGYYADSDGDLYQMVRDADFAWAQGVRSAGLVRPRPSWWRDEYVSYNTCMLSIEIEGFAGTIGETFTVGSRQFAAVVAWSAFVCAKYQIPVQRAYHVGHDELSRHKRDPGSDFPWDALLAGVAAQLALFEPPLEARMAELERRVAVLEGDR